MTVERKVVRLKKINKKQILYLRRNHNLNFFNNGKRNRDDDDGVRDDGSDREGSNRDGSNRRDGDDRDS